MTDFRGKEIGGADMMLGIPARVDCSSGEKEKVTELKSMQ